MCPTNQLFIQQTVAPCPVLPQELGLSGERIRQLQLIRGRLCEHVLEP